MGDIEQRAQATSVREDATSAKRQAFEAGIYVTELLRAALEGRKPQKLPDNLTLEQICRMAKNHSVECMAYYGAARMADAGDAAVLAKWKARATQCGIQGMVQKAEGDRLFRELTGQGIRILPLKGCIMKDLYPKREYRQMSDLDILIDRENAGRAREIMEHLGYVTDSFGNGTHDHYTKEPWTTVELHWHMLSPVYRNSRKYRDIWNRTEEKDGICRQSWDDYYIYMIEHFAKHYYGSGSGIRSVMDVHVFLQKMGGRLHRDYLKEQFEERKLQEFREMMEALAREWFETGRTGRLRQTEENVIFSGTYGTREGRYRNYGEKISKKYRIPGLTKPMYFLKRMFPGYQAMRGIYHFLEKFPFLLPFTWVHRLASALIVKRDVVKKEFQFIKGRKDEGK